jgi:dinuclear metal center YbgI/SA1388 family protein
MTSASSLAQVVAALERRYPPGTAESWDAVGLVCGDPSASVRRILWAVDPVEAVIDEAVDLGVDLVVTHHPLFLSGVHSVAATSAKGRVVHRLIASGIALYCAHTNADAADPGVSDALAAALGVASTRPVIPTAGPGLDTLVVMVPRDHADALRAALAQAGAGDLGDYSACSFESAGVGRFRAASTASPAVGQAGADSAVDELRVEMPVPRARRQAVLEALRSAHPYEEPAYEIHERAALPASTGLGRIGDVAQSMTLAEFGALVASALPPTHHGVRIAGDPGRQVRRVAVCGGSGDSLLTAATALGADVLVTADLKHHRALEHVEEGGCAIVDVAHWASEWPWLAQAALLLDEDLAAEGTTVESIVSDRPTDPWAMTLRGEL